MKAKRIKEKVWWFGAVDWNRRLFDSLIPLPDGTGYNAYYIEGEAKNVLIDAVDPALLDYLIDHLNQVPKLDYLVCQHVEQDHAGGIPYVMERYPQAILLCSAKAKELLIDHLHISPERIRVVEDGEKVDLGGKSLQFVYTPWVHWPETMSTYLAEDKMVFTGDFLGSHMAQSDLYAGEDVAVVEAAKRYYAEIMMPFRSFVQKNLAKLGALDFDLICPSHGPVWDKPEIILNAYADWSSDRLDNLVVLPYISMHGSTEKMADYLTSALVQRGVQVEKFELSTTDIGKLAMSLIHAATIVIGAPTVHVGPHPNVFAITQLANMLRPKLKYAAIVGSYGWSTKVVEQLSALIPNLRVEVLDTVLCKGLPREATYTQLDALADKIKEKHRDIPKN